MQPGGAGKESPASEASDPSSLSVNSPPRHRGQPDGPPLSRRPIHRLGRRASHRSAGLQHVGFARLGKPVRRVQCPPRAVCLRARLHVKLAGRTKSANRAGLTIPSVLSSVFSSLCALCLCGCSSAGFCFVVLAVPEDQALPEPRRQGVEIRAGCVSTGDQHRLVACPLVIEDVDPGVDRHRFNSAVAKGPNFIVEVGRRRPA